MIKHPEVLRMAGFLLDRPDRRNSSFPACTSDGYLCMPCDTRAVKWSLDGAVMACAVKLRQTSLGSLADLTTLFGTQNYASHWDGSLKAPRWTQDQMVEMLKAV